MAPLEIGALEPVRSAADGTFSLPALEEPHFTLLAAQGRDSARLTVDLTVEKQTNVLTTGAVLTLVPPAPIDVAALVQKLSAGGSAEWNGDIFQSGIGIEILEQIARAQSEAFDEANPLAPEQAGTVLSQFVRAAALASPEWTRQNGERLLSLLPAGESKIGAEASVALLRAQSKTASEQALTSDWLERENAVAGGLTDATVARYLQLALVARALQRPDAPGRLDFAAQIGDQLPEALRLKNALDWGQSAAGFGEIALARFSENWGSRARFAALAGAARTYAQSGEIEAARRAISAMEKLALDPLFNKAPVTDELPFSAPPNPPALLLDGARASLVRALAISALAERDLPVALAEATGIGDVSLHQNALLWIANAARLQGDKTIATSALRQVAALDGDGTKSNALAVWYGFQIDAALGQELLALERTRLKSKYAFGDRFGIGDLAFYLGRIDPAQSRLLIEREWSARAAKWGKIGASFGVPWIQPARLVRAMMVIDPARALEMAAQLQPTGIESTELSDGFRRQQTQWIVPLVADEKARARGDLSEPF